MVVHPSVDFRGIAVHDLPNLVWVQVPIGGGPAGLRWRMNGQLVGSGMVGRVPLTTVAARRPARKRRGKGNGKGKKGKKRVDESEEDDGMGVGAEGEGEEAADEAVKGEVDENGGWGPGSDGDGDAASSIDDGEAQGGVRMMNGVNEDMVEEYRGAVEA